MAKHSELHRIFCQNVIRRRQALGLTQADVAERLGVARPVYTQIESGRTTPGLDTVERVASALGTTPVELLGAEIPVPA